MIVHHGIRRGEVLAQFYIRANKFYYADTREQYIDATDENGLKYKLPDIVDALNNGLGAFYLNHLIWLNVFLSLVLATLICEQITLQ